MLLEEVWNSSYSDILAVLAAPPPQSWTLQNKICLVEQSLIGVPS